jgi:hypothetical protein
MPESCITVKAAAVAAVLAEIESARAFASGCLNPLRAQGASPPPAASAMASATAWPLPDDGDCAMASATLEPDLRASQMDCSEAAAAKY